MSMRTTLERPELASRERTQYFETVGHRAIWKDGWKAVAFHKRGSEFGDDRWELYHVDEDFSEAHDLAEQHPHKLRELVDAWWVEARRNKVLPLEDRGFAERANVKFRPHSPRDRARFRLPQRDAAHRDRCRSTHRRSVVRDQRRHPAAARI